MWLHALGPPWVLCWCERNALLPHLEPRFATDQGGLWPFVSLGPFLKGLHPQCSPESCVSSLALCPRPATARDAQPGLPTLVWMNSRREGPWVGLQSCCRWCVWSWSLWWWAPDALCSCLRHWGPTSVCSGSNSDLKLLSAHNSLSSVFL